MQRVGVQWMSGSKSWMKRGKYHLVWYRLCSSVSAKWCSLSGHRSRKIIKWDQQYHYTDPLLTCHLLTQDLMDLLWPEVTKLSVQHIEVYRFKILAKHEFGLISADNSISIVTVWIMIFILFMFKVQINKYKLFYCFCFQFRALMTFGHTVWLKRVRLHTEARLRLQES